MNQIWEHATASPLTTAATTVVALLVLYLVYRFLIEVVSGAGKIGQTLVNLLRELAREIMGGARLASYERINALVVVLIFAFGVFFFVLLLLVQSGRAIVAGGEPVSNTLVAATLICMFSLLGAGLVCVRFCRRHKDDLEAAKKLVPPG